MRMSLYRKNIFAGPTRLPRRIPDLKDESAELDEDLRWGEFKLMKCSRKALEEQEETISECSVASSKKSSGESCSKKEAVVTGSSENSEFTVAKTSWRSESEETLNDKKLVTAAGWSESTMEPEEEKEEGQEDEEGQEQEKQEKLEQQEKQLEQEEVEEPEEENSKLMELRVLSKQERIENFRKSKRLWNHGSRRFEETDPQNKYKSFEDVLQEPPSTRLKEEVGLPLHLSREVSIDRYPLSRLEKILDSFDTDPFAKDFESFCDAVMFGKRKEGSTSNEKGGNPDPQIHKMNEISDKILSEGPIKLKRKDELSQKLKCLLL